MNKIYIYKFMCERNADSAYVLTTYGQENKARKMMSDVTALKIVLVDSRPLDDFPAAREHYDRYGECIWRNNIEVF